MVKYIPIMINAAVLIYGGVIDFRKKEIPDAVPITLLITGSFLNFCLLQSILGLVVPAVLMFIASKITKSEIPGGDFKLLCSLGFTCGLEELTAIVFLAGIGALVYGLIKHLPLKRQIPLCSYIAPAYITLQIIVLALDGG
jgi:prepilin signal peptidase PulO-like enzyme (type II secretory pathway)